MWNEGKTWQEAEKEWDAGSQDAFKKFPIKKLTALPNMPGMTTETARNLKWKSLRWMITQDHDKAVLKGFLQHPFKYGWSLIKSAVKTKPFVREGDFFYYGIQSSQEFELLLQSPHHLFVVGFSYCHKPFECPSGRFTPECIHDKENPVCRQCFIGKAIHALPEENCIPLVIPTIHYIGSKIMEIVHANPSKQVVFLITACEMTLEMFGDWGNMVNIKGIGVRLDGRICNTMKAFELSEQGIKPGLTVVLEPTKQQMLDWIKIRRSNRPHAASNFEF